MLTDEQITKLADAIAADPALSALAADRRDDLIADAFNAPSDPPFTVWRTHVQREEFEEDDGFNWTVVDNLSTGSKYRIWEWMFGEKGYINPSKANIRAGIAATWVGNAALLLVQAMVLAKCKRVASRAEVLEASGVGTVADPGNAPVWLISTNDISQVLNAQGA